MQKFLAKRGYIIVLVVLLTVGVYMMNFNTSYSDKTNNSKILYEEIINNNSIYDVTENDEVDGLFYDNASNEYYFNGNVENNYIVINNELWRIVGINEDKSVKVIKQSGINDNKLYAYNTDYSNFKYQDSIVFKELLSWYNDNLSNVDEYILDSEYCINYQNGECFETGRYKIGLLDISEVRRAGGEINTNNDAYYLYNENDWWIIDTDYDEMLGSAFSSYVNLLGSIDKGFVDEEMTIRPVVILKKEVPINGRGTLDDPYYIVK